MCDKRKSMREELSLFEEELSSLDANKPVKPKQKQKPLIKSVSPILGDNKDFEQYFKPIAVAFGPLHHDVNRDSRLERGEISKIQMAAKFIKHSGTDKGVFYSKVKEEIKSLKECYDSKQTGQWEDEVLAWRFVVDCCAALLFIDLDANDNLKALEVKVDLLAYVKMDLFLLENQLPYQLLQILMDNCAGVPRDPLAEKDENQSPAEVLKSSIDIFINKNAMSPVEQELQKHRRRQPQPQQQQLEIPIEEEEEEGPAHLLDLLWRRLTKSEIAKESDISLNRKPRSTTRYNQRTIRNVKKLKEKGIFLEVSKTSNIRDISLQEYFCVATLRLPPITVDDFTVPKLMNLIAYEMCPDFENEFEITSYVSFLDYLIDQAEDVKELKNTGLLQNGLGSDNDVALLFNKIRRNLVPNPDLHSDLRLRIEAHCHTPFAIYVAQLYHTYFWSPWSFLAFLGALLGLGLIAMQTYEDFH